MKKVAVILVVYKSRDHLEELYSSLDKQSMKDFELFFIDNSPDDESLLYSKEIEKRFSFRINYFKTGANLGYAGGNNFGVKKAYEKGFPYFFVLNADLELDKDCLKELQQLCEAREDTAVAGPIIFLWNPDKQKNIIQSYGVKTNFKNQRKIKLYNKQVFDKSRIPDEIRVDFVGGAAVMIKRAAYEKAGLFEEKYFMYNDELDFGYRIKKAGYKTRVTSKAKVWHHHSHAENDHAFLRETYYNIRNRYIYAGKYNFRIYQMKRFLDDLFLVPLRYKGRIKRGKFRVFKYHYKGLWDGITGKTGFNENI